MSPPRKVLVLRVLDAAWEYARAHERMAWARNRDESGYYAGQDREGMEAWDRMRESLAELAEPSA